MVSTPRINTQLAIAIRMAKLARSKGVGGSTTPKVHCIDHYAIRVTIPKDHFGSIVAENDLVVATKVSIYVIVSIGTGAIF